MSPLRLLFILPDLTQGGSGRYLHEVCRALDRERCSVSVLTLRSSQPTDHYHLRLLDLGVTVHAKLSRLPRVLLDLLPDKRRTRTARRAITTSIDTIEQRLQGAQLGSFFEQFDAIAVIQIETFLWLQRALARHPNVVIHLVSELWQYQANPYLQCLPRRYRLVVQHSYQLEDVRQSALEGAEAIDFPLPLSFVDRDDVYTYPLGAEPKIAVFIRVDPQRPFDGLIYSFQALLERAPGARLHLFGGGDRSAVERLLGLLHIRDRVVFEGHSTDLGGALREGRFHLGWMTCVGQHVGYSSIEVSSYGIPLVFWNFGRAAPAEVSAETSGAVQVANTVPALVELTLSLLADEPLLRRLGRELRAHLRARHDISPRIGALEAFYAKAAGA
jgi:glycosyltransferase involved in cell wall biosynthesis